jgi:uncharacterized protein YggU (UPF0235/DUF167 family)
LNDTNFNLNNYLPNLKVIFEKDGKLLFKISVQVHPGTKIQKVALGKETTFVIHTNQKPTDGKANESVILILANTFEISKSRVILHKGDKSKIKSFYIKIDFSTSKKKKDFYQKIILISKEQT